MKCKTAFLIINPRSGANLATLTEVLGVLSAAGWETEVALKEFGGHAMQLAKRAAEAGYDLVVGYGGDGTLSQVVNGVMAAKRRHSIVGVIPGGTANVWAHEIGMPQDSIGACLALVNSEGRKVDLGHVEIDGVSGAQENRRREPRGKHHFLLMAGLGTDAAVLRRVHTSLKEKIGEAAVALAAVEELPSTHAFPIELRASGGAGGEPVLWKGEALQVVVGNTGRYANVAVTPDAHIDDGALDVCVITAGGPLSTVAQLFSILLRREPVHGSSQHFRAAHFWISVPAEVGLQLDGSPVKHRDRFDDADGVLVTYRFDAKPHALRMAIPCTYEGALFEETHGKKGVSHPEAPRSAPARRQSTEQMQALLEGGRKVTVVAVGPNPDRKGSFIVAGDTSAKSTGEPRPVAVRIDDGTTLVRPSGEALAGSSVAELARGAVILVEGKQSKRGVIRATRVAVGS